MSGGRVFIVESPNPLDLLEGRSERLSLEQVCRLMGHKPASFLIRDLVELEQTLAYISTISGRKEDKTPLFIHISAHGNKQGIACGSDGISWKDLAAIIQRMYTNLKYYHGHVIVIISACGSNAQTVTSELAADLSGVAEKFIPPEYLFVWSDEIVQWTDAVVAWTIFYREVTRVDFDKKQTVQDLLCKLHRAGFHLKYYRWDGKKYLHFKAKDK